MTTINSEFQQVWGRVKEWPLDLRQNLAEEIAKSVESELPEPLEPWTEAKNAHRFELVDKDIQGMLDEQGKRELELLTREMRAHRRRVGPLPLEEAAKLHEQLLESKRQQEEKQSEGA